MWSRRLGIPQLDKDRWKVNRNKISVLDTQLDIGWTCEDGGSLSFKEKVLVDTHKQLGSATKIWCIVRALLAGILQANRSRSVLTVGDFESAVGEGGSVVWTVLVLSGQIVKWLGRVGRNLPPDQDFYQPHKISDIMPWNWLWSDILWEEMLFLGFYVTLFALVLPENPSSIALTIMFCQKQLHSCKQATEAEISRKPFTELSMSAALTQTPALHQ